MPGKISLVYGPLSIVDDTAGDSGSLNCWCLEITSLGSSVTFVLSPPVATNDVAVNTTHTVTALVEFEGFPGTGELVDFEIISGPNAGLSSVPNNGECVPDNCETDANGEVSWTYSSNLKLGTDTITASFDRGDILIFSNVAQKTWVRISNVPTLSEWGLIATAGLLGIVGFMVIRRRKLTA